MSTVAGLLKTLFRNRRPRPPRSRTLPAEQQQLETLENRLAMAVDIAFQTPTGGAGEEWLTILANAGSDAYVQRVASASNDLFIADNSSFGDREVVPNADTAFDNLYVFNGQRVERATSFANDETRFGVPIGYPAGAVSSMEFRFRDSVSTGELITGRVRLANGDPDITFTNDNGDGSFGPNFSLKLASPTK